MPHLQAKYVGGFIQKRKWIVTKKETVDLPELLIILAES